MPIDYSQYKPIQTVISNMPMWQLILPNMSISGKFKYPESKIAPLTQSEQAQLGQRAANLASRVARTSSTEALESAVKSTSPSFSKFSKEAAIKELASRGVSTNTPQSKIPSMPTAKSVGTLIPDVGSRPFIPRLGNVAPFVPALVGALLAKPVEALGEATARNIVRPFAENVDRALGLLPSLKAGETLELANRKYDKALKQAQGRQADRQRINNGGLLTAAPVGSDSSSTVPNAQTLARLAAEGDEGGYQALRSDNLWVGSGFRNFTGAEIAQLRFYANNEEARADGWVIDNGTAVLTYFKGVRSAESLIPIVNTAPAPAFNPAPIAPPTDTFANFGGVLDLSGSVPELAKKPSNNPLPFKEPTESPAFNVAPAPPTDRNDRNPVNPNNGLRNGASGFPQIGGASTASNPVTASPSFSKPAFSARPFISGKSDPSELGNPRDSATGLTRDELEKQFSDKQAKFQNDANANQRQAALNDAKSIQQQLQNLSNVPNAANGGKSDRQIATENYENLIRDNPVRRDAFNSTRNITTPLNTTPSTPISGNNSLQTIAGLAAIAATVTALKIGSDLLVNNSLNNTPKINNIAQNTTPAAQQTNAKQGVCDAMQPDQCGFQGVQAATNPIKDIATANNGLLGNLLALLNNLITFLQNQLGKILTMLNNGVVDRTIATLSLVTNIHNAAMLTRDIGETLGSAVDNVLSLANLQFKNSEGAQVPFSDFIGANFRSFLVQVLGAENYASLVLNWQKANTIYHSGMAVINTTQSMLDPISSAVEYGMENVSKLGNAAREDGLVSENAYPAMDETIRARRVNRFERLNDTLEGAENISSNLASVTSNAVSVKEDFKQLRDDAKVFKDQAKAFRDDDTEARVELKASLPTDITAITIAPAPTEDN